METDLLDDFEEPSFQKLTSLQVFTKIWYNPVTVFNFIFGSKYDRFIQGIISLPIPLYILTTIISKSLYQYIYMPFAGILAIPFCWMFWYLYAFFYQIPIRLLGCKTEYYPLIIVILHAFIPFLTFFIFSPIIFVYVDRFYYIVDTKINVTDSIYYLVIFWSLSLSGIAISRLTKLENIKVLTVILVGNVFMFGVIDLINFLINGQWITF